MVEGVTYVTINNEGFRDINHAVAKGPETFRVVVLGDSNAEAFQVRQEDTFWSVLERRLQSCPWLSRRPVEVLNFGVSGYSTTQELLTYEKFARKYRPDIVLLAFFIGNDLRENVRSLTEAGPPIGILRPFHTLSGDALVLDNSFLKATADWGKPDWFDHSRIVRMVRMVASWLKYRSQRIVDARALISPPDPEYQGAWNVTEKILARLNTEVKADGARLVVATVSTGQQVDPDPERRSRNASQGSISGPVLPRQTSLPALSRNRISNDPIGSRDVGGRRTHQSVLSWLSQYGAGRRALEPERPLRGRPDHGQGNLPGVAVPLNCLGESG